MTDLEIMDTNKDGHVSKAEFLVYMLTALQRVGQKDIQELLELFDRLDKDRTGVLHKADLEMSFQSFKQTLGDISVAESSRGSVLNSSTTEMAPLTAEQSERLRRSSNVWRGEVPAAPTIKIPTMKMPHMILRRIPEEHHGGAPTGNDGYTGP